MKKITKKGLGWRPEHPDQRDIPYLAIRPASFLPIALPQKVDLRKDIPLVYDQSTIGSCVANAVVGAYEIELAKKGSLNTHLSRMFIYYNARLMEGTVNIDAGAYIRDGIKTVAKQGVCVESLCPYVVRNFKVRPSAQAYTEAQNHQAILYASVSKNTRDICTALADGFPVVFGFTVYESFMTPETARTGVLNMPKPKERVVGGHAVIMMGYDEMKQQFLVRNSWGVSWGQKGYFFMPYSYVPRLTDDYWVIKSVE